MLNAHHRPAAAVARRAMAIALAGLTALPLVASAQDTIIGPPPPPPVWQPPTRYGAEDHDRLVESLLLRDPQPWQGGSVALRFEGASFATTGTPGADPAPVVGGMRAYGAASVATRQMGSFRGQLDGGYAVTSGDGGGETGNGLARARLLIGGAKLGGWVGGNSRFLSGSVSRTVLLADAGLWRRFGGFVVQGTFGSTLHTSGQEMAFQNTGFIDSSGSGHSPWRQIVVPARPYHEAGLSVGVAHGALSFDALIGARFTSDFGSSVAQWANVESAWWVTRQFALVGRLEHQRGLESLGGDRRTTGALGVRLASLEFGKGRHDKTSEPSSDNGAEMLSERAGDVRHAVIVRAPGAHQVEIIGDLTDWHPVSLLQDTDGIWRVTLQVSSGVYRVNVRVDGGAWRAPRGLPTRDDDFDGRVGVLTIP